MANSQTKLRLTFGDCTLGVAGAGFEYLYSFDKHGLESLSYGGRQWCYRPPRPAFWRATTDNDRGMAFDVSSAQWLGADLFSPVTAQSVVIDGESVPLPIAPVNNQWSGPVSAGQVAVSFTYQTATVPSTKVAVTYTVGLGGIMTVQVRFTGNAALPELPVFGWRLIAPTPASGFTYTGLSDETYPDRMAGGVPGTYQVTGMPVTPYVRPQDCGVHMQTSALTVTRSTTQNNADHQQTSFGLRVGMVDNAPFAFSCLPYTPAELENATHPNELPPVRRTVLTIMGAVRGVGGIDTWGSDVEPPYRLSAAVDREFAFTVQPA